MIDQTQKLIYTTISMFITLLIYLILWQIASRIDIPSYAELPLNDYQHMKIWNIRLNSQPDSEQQTFADMTKTLLEKRQEIFDRFFEQREFKVKSVLDIEKLTPDFNDNEFMPDNANSNNQTFPSATPSINKLLIDGNDLTEERLALNRRLISKTKSKAPVAKRTRPKLKNIQVELKIDEPQIVEKFTAPTVQESITPEKIPESSPIKPIIKPIASVKQTITDSHLYTTDEVIPEEVQIIDSFLDVILSIYKDPGSNSSYYEIQITTRDKAATVPYIPKDVLLLVDSSASIKFEKLKEFKKGVIQSLAYLNEKDKFNIVAFRDHPRPLFDEFKANNMMHKIEAEEFIGKLQYSGKTDVYSGLAPYVSLKRDEETRPFIIYLISDGQTTTGFKFENNELIRRIIDKNTSNASIFTFSSGSKTNRFLMDFLSFNNRGVSAHSRQVTDSHQELVKFISSLSDIIVSNLNYNISDNLQGEVYPKNLPRLYRNHPLKLYGKMDDSIKEIAIQVVGRSKNGKKEELIAKLNISDASAGTYEIADSWALQKIYYLINNSIMKRTLDLNTSIKHLSQKFNIDIPY